MAYDGDNAARLISRAILANDPNALNQVSERISLGNEIVKRWAEEYGGKAISGGGDEGTFSIPAEALDNIEQLRLDYHFATGLTVTIGVGNSLSEAGKSLLVGKRNGKNAVVQYSPNIDHEVQSIANESDQKAKPEEKSNEGAPAMKNENDEKNSGCSYCEELDAADDKDLDHCQYCHDMDSNSDEDSCPYCAEENNSVHNADEENHPEDCPYCQEVESTEDVESTEGPNTENPTTTDSEDFEGQDLDRPAISKPDPNEEPKMGLGISSDSPSNENRKLDETQGEEDEIQETGESQETDVADGQGKEAMAAIAEELESDGSEAETEKDVMDRLDAEDLAIGNTMEDNVSRPEQYDDNVPGDMGLGEEEQEENPDLTEVLHEGLDSHAENIQREKIVQMVGEALEGFKGCKDILERAKEQAPQLYESSIAMLRAMISMAEMLGLGQETEESVVGGPVDQAGEAEIDPTEDGHPDYGNLFPKHQENGGSAATPGGAASNDPKFLGQ